MKQITLISGKNKYISDQEAENIKKVASRGGFVELRSGELINTSSISTIGEVEKIEHWSTYPVYTTKSGKYIIREGEQCFLEPKNIQEITYELPEEIKQNHEVLRLMGQEERVLQDGVSPRRGLQSGNERENR